MTGEGASPRRRSQVESAKYAALTSAGGTERGRRSLRSDTAEGDWRAIEKALGRPIESTVRRRIEGMVAGQDDSEPLSATYLAPDGLLYTDMRIGMPLTGICNMAEAPLLKECGHTRWEHVEALSGVPSRKLCDEDGERLYATFMYVELMFPPQRPMGTFMENERLTLVSTLRRFGGFFLDGEHFLCPAGWRAAERDFVPDVGWAVAEGIPWLRMTNAFVRQWGGADWLKKGRPVNPGIENIPSTQDLPVGVEVLPRVREAESFPEPGDGFTPMPDTELVTSYEIVPDRDLNGVGLLYFANYPRYLDICERDLLVASDELPFTSDLLDARSLVHRRIAYLSNASANDVLEIRLRCWVENPYLTGAAHPESEPVTLHFNHRMHRRSDGRLMMIATARKTLHGFVLGDTPLMEPLARAAAAKSANHRRHQ